MADRAQLQIRILETLAAPVIVAASSAADPAQAVAQLLGIAAQQAASAAPLLAVPAADGDAARLALAAVAARALIGQGTATDGAKVGEALRAALDGMDALLPTAARLESLNDGVAHDAVQLGLQRAAALAPVIAAIATQPLGQDEAEAAKAAADQISSRASAARQTLVPQLNGAEGAVAEVTLYRAMASLYAAVHSAEAAKKSTPAAITTSFDKQADMLLALAANLLPGGSTGRAPAPATAAPPPPPVPQPPPAPASPPAAPAAPPASGGGNPMSFFKPGAKKTPPAEGGDSGAA